MEKEREIKVRPKVKVEDGAVKVESEEGGDGVEIEVKPPDQEEDVEMRPEPTDQKEDMSIKSERTCIQHIIPCHPDTDTQSNTIPVYERITITVPEDIHDDDPSTSASQPWHDLLGALAAREGCAGLIKYKCHWGLVLEDRSQMYILTS